MCGFSHQGHAARSRMNHGFGLKRRVQGIGTVGKVSRNAARIDGLCHGAGAGLKRILIGAFGNGRGMHYSIASVFSVIVCK